MKLCGTSVGQVCLRTTESVVHNVVVDCVIHIASDGFVVSTA